MSIAELTAEIREATLRANGKQATAVRRVQAKYHSDKNGDTSMFKLIPEALADIQLEDDAGNPDEQMQESSRLMVGCGNHAAEKEARMKERRRKFAEEQERKRRDLVPLAPVGAHRLGPAAGASKAMQRLRDAYAMRAHEEAGRVEDDEESDEGVRRWR